MEKLKRATRRIVAIGTAVAVTSATIFGASLGNYPSNFVKDGKFDGQIVVGADAATIDTTSANSIIQDLRAEFSGESDKVKIIYKGTNGGKTLNAVDDNKRLNYGDDLEDVTYQFDDKESDVLEDLKFDEEEYSQTIDLLNGEFNYRRFGNDNDAKVGLYYESGEAFAVYELDFGNNEFDVDSDAADDLQGEELVIMGNSFTVSEISNTSVTLLGGANKLSLGEGDASTATIEGKPYDIAVQSVSSDKVLLTVNGISKSVGIYDTEKIAGINIVVTDLVESSRESVKGYAELVIGGNKIELESDGDISINDEDFEDVFEDYEAEVEFLPQSGDDMFAGFNITYSVAEDTLLAEGDILEDVLFQTFTLVYEGVNDVDYSIVTIRSTSDTITFQGELESGDDLPSDFKLTTNDNEEDGTDDNDPLWLGSDSDRIFFGDSQDIDETEAFDDTADRDGGDIVAGALGVDINISVSSPDAIGEKLLQIDSDDQLYLYEITKIKDDDEEISFEDLVSGDTFNDIDLEDDDLNDLEGMTTSSYTSPILTVLYADLGSKVRFANNLDMDISAAEVAEFNTTSGSVITFGYDVDISTEESALETALAAVAYDVTFTRGGIGADIDDDIEISIDETNFVGSAFEDVDRDSDFDFLVDEYGTYVEVNVEDDNELVIKVPDEELYGIVSFVFGEATETSYVIVDADEVADKKAELEDDGYTIVKTESISSEDVEFDIDGVVFDTEVGAAEDMIVVGGPAVNSIARDLLGIGTYRIELAGVDPGEGVIKYFEDSNTILVYGYEGADTAAAVARLNEGGLSGDEETIR